MHGAQREAHQRTQAEAVPQRALEQQELQRAAEQAWRHDQAVLQAHMQRAQQLQVGVGDASRGRCERVTRSLPSQCRVCTPCGCYRVHPSWSGGPGRCASPYGLAPAGQAADPAS